MTAFGEASPQDEEYDPGIARTLQIKRGSARRVKPERTVVADGRALIFTRGGYARKVHGGAYGNTGEPDLDGCLRGRALKFEAKRIGERPAGPQMAALRRWATVGALVGWFRTDGELGDLLDHADEQGFVPPDLTRPGCTCPRHGDAR